MPTGPDPKRRHITCSTATPAPSGYVHVSSNDALKHVVNARDEGLPVFAETCPHGLLFDDSEYRSRRLGLFQIGVMPGRLSLNRFVQLTARRRSSSSACFRRRAPSRWAATPTSRCSTRTLQSTSTTAASSLAPATTSVRSKRFLTPA